MGNGVLTNGVPRVRVCCKRATPWGSLAHPQAEGEGWCPWIRMKS